MSSIEIRSEAAREAVSGLRKIGLHSEAIKDTLRGCFTENELHSALSRPETGPPSPACQQVTIPPPACQCTSQVAILSGRIVEIRHELGELKDEFHRALTLRECRHVPDGAGKCLRCEASLV